MKNPPFYDKTGIIYVKVALYLEADVDEEEAQEIVSEVDYDFKHPMISHTKIQEVFD